MPSAPPLELLAAFVRVADTGSFTSAARALLLSKATVSKQIAELESRLGVQLFHRTTRKLSLTEAGVNALARAERVLAEAEALVEEAGEARERPHGRLRISAPMTFGLDYLAPALPEFLSAYPDIELELLLDDRQVDLVAERFDAALRISEMADSSLVARTLAPVRLNVVAAHSYWRAHGKPHRPEELQKHACFLYANSPEAAVWRFRDAHEHDVRVRVSGPFCVNNGGAALPALRAGLGVGLLPDFSVWQDLKTHKLECALEDWRGPDLRLHLLTPHGRTQPRRLRAFSDFVHEKFSGGRAPWIAAAAAV